MLGRLNHVAIAVKDAEKAARIYGAAFGADISAAVPLPEHGVITVFVTLPNTKIEFIQPLGEASPIAKFLERNADCVGRDAGTQLAFRVVHEDLHRKHKLGSFLFRLHVLGSELRNRRFIDHLSVKLLSTVNRNSSFLAKRNPAYQLFIHVNRQLHLVEIRDADEIRTGTDELARLNRSQGNRSARRREDMAVPDLFLQLFRLRNGLVASCTDGSHLLRSPFPRRSFWLPWSRRAAPR